MEAVQFHSFEVDDTLKKKARLGGETVANTEEPAVEVADETALKHTRKTPAISQLCPKNGKRFCPFFMSVLMKR